ECRRAMAAPRRRSRCGLDHPMMEEHVPRTPWRRRRTTDSPRPAGRRWAGRLRRGGSLARQALLVRVGRRPGETGRGSTMRSEVLYTGSDAPPYAYGRGRVTSADARTLTTSGATLG